MGRDSCDQRASLPFARQAELPSGAADLYPITLTWPQLQRRCLKYVSTVRWDECRCKAQAFAMSRIAPLYAEPGTVSAGINNSGDGGLRKSCWSTISHAFHLLHFFTSGPIFFALGLPSPPSRPAAAHSYEATEESLVWKFFSHVPGDQHNFILEAKIKILLQ